MSKEIAVQGQSKLLCYVPQTYEELEKFSEKIANSSLCPKDFKGKPGDVFIVIQMGAEVGLSPMASMQNIAVINGRPCIWGDAMLGIVKAARGFVSCREWIDGSFSTENAVAYCALMRVGQPGEEIRSFSYAQAKKAQLIGQNVWAKYPERMLQMRARGFACRDVFPDALRGLQSGEEQQDILDVTSISKSEIIENKKTEKKLDEGTPLSQTYAVDQNEVDRFVKEINNAKSVEELQDFYRDGKAFCNGDKAASNEISKATKNRKSFLEAASKVKPELTPEEKAGADDWGKEYDGHKAAFDKGVSA